MVPGFPVVGMRRRLEVHDSNPSASTNPIWIHPVSERIQAQGPRAGRHWLCGSRTRRVHAPAPDAPRPAPARRPRLADACYRTGQHVFGAAVALPLPALARGGE